PRADEVTIRQMLTHSSGIAQPFPNPEQMAKIKSVADAAAHFKSAAGVYDFDPGTDQRYSNAGFILLGAIIEKVSGQSYHDFMKENVFDRAGMKASAVDRETDVVPNRAVGY